MNPANDSSSLATSSLITTLESGASSHQALSEIDPMLASICGSKITLFVETPLSQPSGSSIEGPSVIHEGKIYHGLGIEQFETARDGRKVSQQQELAHVKDVFQRTQQEASDAVELLKREEGPERWNRFKQKCRAIQEELNGDHELGLDLRKRIKTLFWRRLENEAGDHVSSLITAQYEEISYHHGSLGFVTLQNMGEDPVFRRAVCGRLNKGEKYRIPKDYPEALEFTGITFEKNIFEMYTPLLRLSGRPWSDQGDGLMLLSNDR